MLQQLSIYKRKYKNVQNTCFYFWKQEHTEQNKIQNINSTDIWKGNNKSKSE